LIGALMKVMAWLVLVGSILMALAAGLAVPIARQFLSDVGLPTDLLALGSAGGLIAGVLLMLIGVVLFLIFYARGESIFLQLAIEENTRMAAALLLRAAEEDKKTGAGAPIRPIYYGDVVD